MKDLSNIQIGIGIGPVKFGMTMEEVAQLIGHPDAVERFSYLEEEDVLAEEWTYSNPDLRLTFNEEEEWRLCRISTYSKEIELCGQSLIGMDRAAFIQSFQESILGEMKMEDLSSVEIPNYQLIYFDKSRVDFWFENDVLMDIEWGPLWQDENTIVWP